MSTSLDWRLYYEHNARSLLEIPWHLGADLTADEVTAIASIAPGRQGRVARVRGLDTSIAPHRDTPSGLGIRST